MKLRRFELILFVALYIVSCLISCMPQSPQEQTPDANNTPVTITPTNIQQTAVWGGLTFSVIETEWEGNAVKLRVKIENKGNQTATFNSVFYAYEENGSRTRMCQSTLNLWGTYGVDDTRSQIIHFILPVSSSDVWLAIEATKIIRVPHKLVPQPVEMKRQHTFQGATWSFSLKKVEWTGNRVCVTISIENTGNSGQVFQFTERDISKGSSMFYLGGLEPIGNKFQWRVDWYIGSYALGDVRSGMLCFDVPSCMVGLNLTYRDGNLFKIYR